MGIDQEVAHDLPQQAAVALHRQRLWQRDLQRLALGLQQRPDRRGGLVDDGAQVEAHGPLVEPAGGEEVGDLQPQARGVLARGGQYRPRLGREAGPDAGVEQAEPGVDGGQGRMQLVGGAGEEGGPRAGRLSPPEGLRALLGQPRPLDQ